MWVGTEAALMLLFVPPTSFDGFGEHPYAGTTLSQLLAGLIVIVSFLSLTLTVCYGLVMLLLGVQLELPGGFGPPPPHHLMPSL